MAGAWSILVDRAAARAGHAGRPYGPVQGDRLDPAGFAKALFASAGKDYAALVEAAKHKGFKAVPLGVKANVSGQHDPPPGLEERRRHPARQRAAGRVVLYSAHWDHLGRCDAVNGDDICNGALDNASGTAALVALAEAHAKAGPAKRSLVFLAVTAEESGLLGSKFYAENPVYPLARRWAG
jgi:hypothetical protein